MKGKPTTFWGKLKQNEHKRVSEWHPLSAHCADVAACTEALLDRTLLRRRLARLGARDDLDAVDVSRLSFLAALHDIGKHNLGFQRKGDTEPKHTAGHVAEMLALVGSGYPEESKLMGALPVAEIEAWCHDGRVLELLVAAIGHHGRPVRCGAIAVDPSLWRGEERLDPFEGIASLVGAARNWFPAAFAHGGVLPNLPAFQHGFAGLVMLADWLGSDSEFFRFADDLEDRMPFARAKARQLVCAIGLDVDVGRQSLGNAVPGFDRISPYPPREAQSTTLRLPRPEAGGLVILESGTGSGKTEAALGRFVQLFHAGLVDGMVFALPTRTAATQLHARVVEAVNRAFPQVEGRPPVVLAVPGYLWVDEARGQRLPGFEVLWNDDHLAQLRHRGWAAEQPKRYLAGAVVVGTIDQVLLSSLRVGHAHLRATALLRHLLVVNEVHASDTYMNRILEEVLRFHLQAGGHAFLMSATLGTYVRRRLERAALGSSALACIETSLEQACRTPYPAVHHAARGTPPQIEDVPGSRLAKRIQVALEGIGDNPQELALRALEAARAGARVLVLRNTVTDARLTQQALEDIATEADTPMLFGVDGVLTLHHARFAKNDRERLDRAIEARFGKHAPAHGGSIVVATQTVQQSLDLDADLMFTDLAPMDVLLQRFGRVHRHPDRDPVRAKGFGDARAVVLTGDPLENSIKPNGEATGRHGVGTVYSDILILEATRRLIFEATQRTVVASRAFVIPAENRELVERTTHPEALDALAKVLGTAWEKHRSRVAGVRLPTRVSRIAISSSAMNPLATTRLRKRG